jgi:hypothetical protein
VPCCVQDPLHPEAAFVDTPPGPLNSLAAPATPQSSSALTLLLSVLYVILHDVFRSAVHVSQCDGCLAALRTHCTPRQLSWALPLGRLPPHRALATPQSSSALTLLLLALYVSQRDMLESAVIDPICDWCHAVCRTHCTLRQLSWPPPWAAQLPRRPYHATKQLSPRPQC